MLRSMGVRTQVLEKEGYDAFKARDKENWYYIIQKLNEDGVAAGPVMQKIVPLSRAEKKKYSTRYPVEMGEAVVYGSFRFRKRWPRAGHETIASALQHLASQMPLQKLDVLYQGTLVAVQIDKDRVDEYLYVPGEGVFARYVELSHQKVKGA